uniref:Transposase-associated domain-containing protein n=1 Tax=Chenopodium quinoa TaxID=63459 RepID=A0A803MGC2_CHEQI
MDQNWMNYPRSSEDFKVALNIFRDDYFAKDAIGDQIFCPCKTCSRRFCHSRDDIYDHLIVNGFVKGFKEWVLQREGYSSTNNDRQTMHEVNNQSTNDDIDGLLHDTFRDVGEGLNRDHEVESEPNEEARNFFHLVEEGKKELYPGCTDLMNELENFENDFEKKSKGGGGKGKTRDHDKARLDLLDLGIKPHLHPYPSEDGSHMLFPPAPYSMSNAKKDLFLKALKETKLPYGYASNIGRCVHVKERNFSGYKTHDAHVILHHLLQVAVRKTLPKNVAVPLTRLGNFFHGKLKSYVRNRSNPEGSIAEGYMMEEFLTIISRYLREGVNTRLDRRCARNFSLNQHDDELSLFPKVGHPIGGKRKRKGKGFTLDFQSLKNAHRYIVFNCDNAIVETYINDIDEFGLTYVNFKKKCSKDNPFVLASQVHQVYYSQDPLEKDIQYVMKRVPRDLFDFEEALNEETYWEEPINSSSNNMPSFDANHIHVGAGGGEVRAVNINDLSDSEDVNNLEDDIDYDNTYWDWMDATVDIPAH